MIQITKGAVPKILTKKGKKLTTQLKRKFTLNRANYINGSVNFKIDDTYNAKSVVKSLRQCHNNKCCFSEAIFDFDYPHVEHFRPKGRIDQWPKGASTYPGYYWLAYDWSNLFLCKSIINSGFKRNFFPLVAGTARTIDHKAKNIETPLLVDPSADDPRDHIRFRGDEPIAITARGRCTIELLNLKHPDFEEARRKKLQVITLLKNTVDGLIAKGINLADPDVAGMVTFLRTEILPTAEFSSMTRDFLSGWPHL
jgi:uncharacterized protein (TIGR02646 family)